MIDLFLNNKRVYISSDSSLKIVRENPYLSTSGDYTFDVILPLSIIENRMFFGPWNRIDFSIDIKIYAARLYVNNKCIINGSAKVTGISDNNVKLQLYGDRSEFNAVHGDKYIDELDLPHLEGREFGQRASFTRTDSGYIPNSGSAEVLKEKDEGWQKFVYASVYNETADFIVNEVSLYYGIDKGKLTRKAFKNSPQFNLLYTLKSIFKAIGYKIDISDYDIEPYDHLIIASCYVSYNMSSVLPHWTLKEFVNQLQLFFGCTFVFSSSDLSVKMVKNKNLESSEDRTCVANHSDNFTIEVANDNNIESADFGNIHYDLSNSEFHDIDFIDNEKIQQLPLKSYDSFDAFMSDFEKMKPYDRNRFLFRTPEGYFCNWIFQGEDEKIPSFTRLIRVNHFRDLTKMINDDNNFVDLKICPVAINGAQPVEISDGNPWGGRGEPMGTMYQVMPSLTGVEHYNHLTSHSRNQRHGTSPIQEVIETNIISSDESKSDRIELYFWNDSVVQCGYSDYYNGDVYDVKAPYVYTDYEFRNLRDIAVKRWTMSLNHCFNEDSDFSVLHNRKPINIEKKYCIQFVADIIYDTSKIFIINNKKYIAESIEYEIKSGEMSKLATGYFYQID